MFATPAKGDELVLNWKDNSSNEEGFLIERAGTDGVFTEIGRTGKNVTTYTDSSMSSERPYWYRLSGYNEYGRSGFTNIVAGGSQSEYYLGRIRGSAKGTFGLELRKDGTINLVSSLAEGSLLPDETVRVDNRGRFRFENPVFGLISGKFVDGNITARNADRSLRLNGSIVGEADWKSLPLVGYYVSDLSSSQEEVLRTLILPNGNVFLSLSTAGNYFSTQGAIVNGNEIKADFEAADVPDLTIEDSPKGKGVVAKVEESSEDAPVITKPSSYLANISVKAHAGDGADALNVSFSIAGDDGKRVLLRALGPTLVPDMASDFITDPVLATSKGKRSLHGLSNDDWGDSTRANKIKSVSRDLGAYPLLSSSKDSAAYSKVSRGQVYANVSSKNGDSGTVFFELYDAEVLESTPSVSWFSGFSARTHVKPSGDVVLGFTVEGSGTQKILLRAVGQELSALGVSNAMKDPEIELYLSEGGVSYLVAENDNWNASDGTVPYVENTTNLEIGSRSSALVGRLMPGTYTLAVKSTLGEGGAVSVELYALSN